MNSEDSHYYKVLMPIRNAKQKTYHDYRDAPLSNPKKWINYV